MPHQRCHLPALANVSHCASGFRDTIAATGQRPLEWSKTRNHACFWVPVTRNEVRTATGLREDAFACRVGICLPGEPSSDHGLPRLPRLSERKLRKPVRCPRRH